LNWVELLRPGDPPALAAAGLDADRYIIRRPAGGVPASERFWSSLEIQSCTRLPAGSSELHWFKARSELRASFTSGGGGRRLLHGSLRCLAPRQVKLIYDLNGQINYSD
jgi:hypothetical protein